MTPHPYPLDSLLQHAKKTPNNIAVETRTNKISYQDFVFRIKCLAKAIFQVKALPKVLIYLPQDIDAYAAMFASHMAGGVYSPVSLDAPIERQSIIATQFEPDVIIARKIDVEKVGTLSKTAKIIFVEEVGDTPLLEEIEPHKLAYVIFTSGSTGIPKGVMISKDSLAHYLNWGIKELGITSKDRVSQHPNIGFDLSVIDIYVTLCGGATLLPLQTPKDRLMPGGFINDMEISVWISVPSVIDLMRKARQVDAKNFKSLRLLFFCGEPLLPEHLDAIFTARPDVGVLNTYGPTEATVSMTQLWITPESMKENCQANVALGKAIPGMALKLIGEGQPEAGEIALIGPQIAEGYWQDEEKTNQAFRLLEDGQRAYFTGDLAEYKNGQLFFQQRADRQIKIHGYRVELGDIDAALRKTGLILAHTVYVDEQLIAYVETNKTIDKAKISEKLAKSVPSYMIPQDIRTLPQLPRNVNDKIDTLALIEMVKNGT